MTNINKIKFDSKFQVSYMNGKYCITGFNHLKSVYIEEIYLYEFIESGSIWNMSEQEWNEYIEDWKN